MVVPAAYSAYRVLIHYLALHLYIPPPPLSPEITNENNESEATPNANATSPADLWATFCAPIFVLSVYELVYYILPYTNYVVNQMVLQHLMQENQEEERETKGEANCSCAAQKGRAAAVHNQSERRRRDRINQKMKALQKLVPNASKTDKASMLDEVIEYLTQLQAQVQMLSNARFVPQMMPLGMQQHLHQMSLLARMGMSATLGMGLGMLETPSINYTPGAPQPMPSSIQLKLRLLPQPLCHQPSLSLKWLLPPSKQILILEPTVQLNWKIPTMHF